MIARALVEITRFASAFLLTWILLALINLGAK
jgi:hypothetical protein